MNKPLYAIAENYLAALQTLESLLDSGEIPQNVFDDTIDGLGGELEAKAINVIGYAKNLEAESMAIDAAIKAMTARKKAIDAKDERLRAYVKEQMERAGITEIKCPYYVIKLRNNPLRVVIDNESGIPEDCWRVIPEKREPDKSAIKAMISTEEVSFAHLERTTRLEIK